MSDLIILCADKKIEATLEGLLNRPESLQIRRIQSKILVHSGRDPGCFHQAAAFLRPFRREYAHALVVFDRAWEGAPSTEAHQLEASVGDALRPDWADHGAAVVIDPELEIWVWSDSPHVAAALGWGRRRHELRPWLARQGLWSEIDRKPSDPKRAVEVAVREVQIPWTAAVCKELAGKVGLNRCEDPAFKRLRSLLVNWFHEARY